MNLVEPQFAPRGDDAVRAHLSDGVRYMRAGSFQRAWQCFESAREATDDPAVHSEALRRQADLKRRHADWGDALKLAREALQIARNHALRDHAAAALNIEGTIHLQRADFGRASSVYLEALEAGPGAHQEGLICQNLGTTHAQQGRFDEAVAWYARSSRAFQLSGHSREHILGLVNQGNVRLDQGDFSAAEAVLREALEGVHQLPTGDAELQALVEVNLAETVARQGGRLEEAFDRLLRATGHFAVSQNRPHRVACHRVLALITELQGYPELAIGALERGRELALEIGSQREAAHFQRELTRLRARCSGQTGTAGQESDR
jgi:tetratricopeptide (TPR) repeat protein